MSEEIRNASTIVPYSLITSLMLNGILGLGMLIAVLFCLGDIDAALDTPTKYPFMEIFFQATDSAAGSTAMIAIITVLQICATIACLAGSSRMTWSFARDHGLPGWRYLSRVWFFCFNSSVSRNVMLMVRIRLTHVLRYQRLQSPSRPQLHVC